MVGHCGDRARGDREVGRIALSPHHHHDNARAVFKCTGLFHHKNLAHSPTLSTRPIELITYLLHRTLSLSYSASSFSSSIERMPSGTGVTTPTISSFTSAAAISVFSSTTGSSTFGSGAFE